MFYDKFKSLCEKKGVSCNKAALELGLSNATPTAWKNRGIVPKGETLTKIASYFGVSTDYLVSDDASVSAGSEDELSVYLEELRTRPEMRMLFSLAQGATKEDVERAVAIIEALRKGNNG